VTDRFLPELVRALRPHKVIAVACGNGDAQTLCITQARTDSDENYFSNSNNTSIAQHQGGNQVWSWGDGDFGKMGRGNMDGSNCPLLISALKVIYFTRSTVPNLVL